VSGTSAGLPPIEVSIDGGAETWAAIDGDLAAGRIDETEWFHRNATVLTAAYLSRDDPRAQSGHSGDEARWEAARRPVLAAVDADGDFLDVGCANGYLMESVHRWAAADGFAIEPYGLDISAGLADLARRRLPRWADRIWVGNALYWRPARRFDYVRTGLEYVPAGRVVDLVAHLLEFVAGRKLIIGVMNEAKDRPWRAQELVEAGHVIAGRREWPKPDDPRVVRRVCWIDKT
jgi:SAM-dependent methyltransferase